MIMDNVKAFKMVISAFFAGRGYFTKHDQPLHGTEWNADVIAVLPVFRELQYRTQVGYASCGIMQYMPPDQWVDFDDVVNATSFTRGFVGGVIDDAKANGWVDIDLSGEKPRVKNIKWKSAAREIIAAFYMNENFEEKIKMLDEYQGVFEQVYFFSPYPVDNETIELLASKGYGLYRYYERPGAFLEMLPSDYFDVTDWGKYAVLAENIIFDNMWMRKDEKL